jgi:putative ABC transport system substrate-binding protein
MFMRRRNFVFGGVAMLAVANRAVGQPRGNIPRIAVTVAQPIPNAFWDAFRRGLRELGYVEGKNIEVEYRSAEGRPDRWPAIFDELVRRKPDVIVAGGGGIALAVARKATSTIPIVSPASSDPAAVGHVASLARPGGNVTGLSIVESDTAAKRLQLLRELLPNIKRVAVLRETAAFAVQLRWTEEAARSLGLEVQVFTAQRPEEFEAAFDAAKAAGAEGLIALPSATFAAHRQRLVHLAAQKRMITFWENRVFTDVGGLISYGPDIAEMYRRAATYVDKILKGAKPADMPIEQATKFDLVINLKTAKAQGVNIPPAMLVRADRIMQ